MSYPGSAPRQLQVFCINGIYAGKGSMGALDCSNGFEVLYINTDDGIIEHNHLLNSLVLFLTNLKQPEMLQLWIYNFVQQLMHGLCWVLTGHNLKCHIFGKALEIENENRLIFCVQIVNEHFIWMKYYGSCMALQGVATERSWLRYKLD